MPALFTIVMHIVRGAALAAGIVAALMASLPVALHDVVGPDHVEVDSCAHHQQPDGQGGPCAPDQGIDDPVEPLPCDPDDCGHCHCALVNVMVPEAYAWSQLAAMTEIEYWTTPLRAIDRLAYPPDPPPARLS